MKFKVLTLIACALMSHAFADVPTPSIQVLVPKNHFITAKDKVWVQYVEQGKSKTATLPLQYGKNSIYSQTLVFRTYPVSLLQADERTEKLRILFTHILPGEKYDLKKNVTRAELAFIFDKISFNRNPEIKFYAFTDVNEKTPYANSIKRVVGAGWLASSSDNRFNPQKELTRAEMLMAVVRYANMNLVQTQAKLPFQDVPAKHWAYPVILTALANNLIVGDTKLNPDQKITRMELYTVLLRLPEMSETLDPWK